MTATTGLVRRGSRAIAAFAFGLSEGVVGALHGVVHGSFGDGLCHGRPAGAELEWQTPRGFIAVFGRLNPEEIDDGGCLGVVNALEQDGKLIAAESGYKAGAAHRVGHPVGNAPERRVAFEMPETVVDFVKEIDVEQREAPFFVGGGTQAVDKLLVPGSAIGKSG